MIKISICWSFYLFVLQPVESLNKIIVMAWPGIEPGSPAYMAAALTSELLTLLVKIRAEIMVTRQNFPGQNFPGKVVMKSGKSCHNSGKSCQPILRS